MNDDLRFMREAYLVAARAVGNSDPNPSVGAVVVSPEGDVLASGYTHRAGFVHAERHALDALSETDLSRATLYVTLEPCCHHGRTPPCVDAILERRIRRVVVAERDLAAEVRGRSVAFLKEKGVDVSLTAPGIFEREAWFTTGPFFFARRHLRPRVTLKWAQTRDGALAPALVAGRAVPSGPISGKVAAYVTAALRSFHKLTMATPGTVRADRPQLTVRFHDIPDLAPAGFSDFFLTLVAQQLAVAVAAPSPEESLTSIKPTQQLRLESSVALRENFAEAMSEKLEEIASKGFNSVLIEAGPVFSRLLLEYGFVDAIAVYRSKSKSAEGLWGSPGRGNDLSNLLASRDTLPGFTAVERADLGEDVFFYFRRGR